jgi:hypothetical protein
MKFYFLTFFVPILLLLLGCAKKNYRYMGEPYLLTKEFKKTCDSLSKISGKKVIGYGRTQSDVRDKMEIIYLENNKQITSVLYDTTIAKKKTEMVYFKDTITISF